MPKNRWFIWVYLWDYLWNIGWDGIIYGINYWQLDDSKCTPIENDGFIMKKNKKCLVSIIDHSGINCRLMWVSRIYWGSSHHQSGWYSWIFIPQDGASYPLIDAWPYALNMTPVGAMDMKLPNHQPCLVATAHLGSNDATCISFLCHREVVSSTSTPPVTTRIPTAGRFLYTEKSLWAASTREMSQIWEFEASKLHLQNPFSAVFFVQLGQLTAPTGAFHDAQIATELHPGLRSWTRAAG